MPFLCLHARFFPIFLIVGVFLAFFPLVLPALPLCLVICLLVVVLLEGVVISIPVVSLLVPDPVHDLDELLLGDGKPVRADIYATHLEGVNPLHDGGKEGTTFVQPGDNPHMD